MLITQENIKKATSRIKRAIKAKGKTHVGRVHFAVIEEKRAKSGKLLRKAGMDLKNGMYMFQHKVTEVKWTTKGTSVKFDFANHKVEPKPKKEKTVSAEK